MSFNSGCLAWPSLAQILIQYKIKIQQAVVYVAEVLAIERRRASGEIRMEIEDDTDGRRSAAKKIQHLLLIGMRSDSRTFTLSGLGFVGFSVVVIVYRQTTSMKRVKPVFMVKFESAAM